MASNLYLSLDLSDLELARGTDLRSGWLVGWISLVDPYATSVELGYITSSKQRSPTGDRPLSTLSFSSGLQESG